MSTENNTDDGTPTQDRSSKPAVAVSKAPRVTVKRAGYETGASVTTSSDPTDRESTEHDRESTEHDRAAANEDAETTESPSAEGPIDVDEVLTGEGSDRSKPEPPV